MIGIRRVYDKPSRADGLRVLVDRLWPRGLTKDRAAVDLWVKDLAPSAELRKWFEHDPAKWVQFQARYRKELGKQNDALKDLKAKAKRQTVTLVYGARDEEHNGALRAEKDARSPPVGRGNTLGEMAFAMSSPAPAKLVDEVSRRLRLDLPLPPVRFLLEGAQELACFYTSPAQET